MGGDDRPDSAVYITLRELYDLLSDTRERLVIMANDVQWVKTTSDGYNERVKELQNEIKALWDANAEIRRQLGDVQLETTGLRATLRTVSQIGSLVISVVVALYVALR
jgi:chromosome segregation ATPase